MRVADMPEGTLVTTTRRPCFWVGQKIQGDMYCLRMTSGGVNFEPIKITPIDRAGPEYIVAFPGTPEWDQINARLMAAMMGVEI